MEVLYEHNTRVHNTDAARVVVPLILELFPFCRTVLDVGCGTGTWLKVFSERSEIEHYRGIDSSAARKKLVIPDHCFQDHDLRTPLVLNQRFDILLCLEVAEHLPEKTADILLDSICRHADLVVFSAAIPGQGGQGHVNEQWPLYWELKFRHRGYSRLDLIRPHIWQNPLVDVWYRQNMYVFTNAAALIAKHREQVGLGEIHPELWMQKISALNRLGQESGEFDKGSAGVIRSGRALIHAIKKKLRT